MTDSDLAALAKRVRVHCVHMIQSAKSAHLGSCLSIADILAVLYGRVLRVDPARPNDPVRDRFIVSKGHAAAALYAVLAESGFADPQALSTFYADGSSLLGHVTRGAMPGVEFSTGSLGHGLPVSVGMAMAGARGVGDFRVFCLMSDGECDEGTTWEAALLASHHRLSNLVVIIDYNKIQSLGTVADVLALEPFAEKWRSFGWTVAEVDGHDHRGLTGVLGTRPSSTPLCVIAHTVKGKGVSFMEETVLWHYRSPQGEEFDRALAELKAADGVARR